MITELDKSQGQRKCRFYYSGQYWRVETNCRAIYNDFEIVRFTKFGENNLGLETDWWEFLKRQTEDFCFVMDPFRRNVTLGNGRNL